MIPTLNGRYQARLFLVLFIAAPWTFIITPFLPAHSNGLSLSDKAKHLYPVTFAALAVVLILGFVLWEWIYYILQLCRWEKDWPAMFFMLQLVPEAILAYVVLRVLGIPQHRTSGVASEYSTFIVHITSTWIVMWLFVLGPIKTLLIRWRFNGGRVFW
jgi:hypothetical protein